MMGLSLAVVHYPYIIAIEPTFVEIWDINSSAIKQVIPGDNLRCLFSEFPASGISSFTPSPTPHRPVLLGSNGDIRILQPMA